MGGSALLVDRPMAVRRAIYRNTEALLADCRRDGVLPVWKSRSRRRETSRNRVWRESPGLVVAAATTATADRPLTGGLPPGPDS